MASRGGSELKEKGEPKRKRASKERKAYKKGRLDTFHSAPKWEGGI